MDYCKFVSNEVLSDRHLGCNIDGCFYCEFGCRSNFHSAISIDWTCNSWRYTICLLSDKNNKRELMKLSLRQNRQ